MSASLSCKDNKAEEYARWRRRDQPHIEAMQNLVIAAIASETHVEMPANVRSLISALQGAHGGGEIAFESFDRDYLTIGAQLQFTGTDEAIRQRVRRWVDDLLRWQHESGYELFAVIKGGEIIGTRPDGTPIRQKTRFIDYLKPRADEAVQRARVSELWRGNSGKGIKAHPGKALASQVDSLKSEMPRSSPPQERKDKKAAATNKLSANEYARRQREAITKAIEKTADEIEERDGDADFWLEQLENTIRRMRVSRQKTVGARRSWIMPDEDEAERIDVNGNTAYMRITDEAQAEPLGITDDTQAEAESPEKTSEPAAISPTKRAALDLAARGFQVFPANGVFDAVCFCLKGSECSSPGKHPISTGWQRQATSNPEEIARLWDKHKHANIGILLGGPRRLIAVDVDPRAGGDASLCDLTEAYGTEFLDTFTQRTGSLGNHFVYSAPEGAEIYDRGKHKGKLGPGIDVKAEGGFIVGAGSSHASGRQYEIESDFPVAEMPAWMIERLTMSPTIETNVVVNFQERRGRVMSGTAIVEGERNDRLFKLGCALWGKGEVSTRADLFSQLLDTNASRVNPPLKTAEVARIAESITRYPPGQRSLVGTSWDLKKA